MASFPNDHYEQPTPEMWQPTPEDKYMANQAYFHYASGLAILHDPTGTEDLHRKNISTPNQKDELLTHAQLLIWSGLSDIIRYSNPPENRVPLMKAEPHHGTALPHMIETVKRVAEEEGDRLDLLNPKLRALLPLPLASAPIYRHVAHGRGGKITVARVMDAFTVDRRFDADTLGRTFNNLPRVKPKPNLKLAS